MGPFQAVGPDIVEGIRIKSQDGPNLILSGSSTLTSPLLEHGPADEVLLAVYPVLLGMGSASLRREPRHAHSSSLARDNVVWHHPQYLQGRRACEDRIVR
jgi:dihydrofolate reductase